MRVSTRSTPRLDHRLVIAVAALMAVGFYLLFSASVFRIGFPLDDSWIHLTYARNFAQHGEWAFRLGQRSAGSTSPLWTFLLSIGYFLKLAPYAWTYFLGWLALTFFGIQAENAARMFVASYKPALPWVGIFFVLEWHFTWSAVSGMETLAHALVLLTVLAALMNGSRQYLSLGLLTGLSVWIRPDGLTLLGPLLFTATLAEPNWDARGKAFLKILIGFGIFFFTYLLFNLALSGNPLPNTFYAKQAEYKSFWLSKTLFQRFGNYLGVTVASPFLALIPGVLVWIKKAIERRNWGTLAGVIWFLGYVGIYFMRLPAYQHGRYIIPALSILYFWGVLGTIELINNLKANKRLVFIWRSVLVTLIIAFAFLGARQNAMDVYWVENEMVATAEWVQQNLPPDAVLAVHDIGALGYFVPNPMIDMAGLINPEIIPFIRDENQLANYLTTHSADYLIVLPGFYPQLTSGLQPVFSAKTDPAILRVDENMQVYPWH
ncbi:MAG: hypothetical protein QM730_20850 [Anaerolineales bacterium]